MLFTMNKSTLIKTAVISTGVIVMMVFAFRYTGVLQQDVENKPDNQPIAKQQLSTNSVLQSSYIPNQERQSVGIRTEVRELEDGSKVVDTIDQNNRLIKSVDQNGKAVVYIYNAKGELRHMPK